MKVCCKDETRYFHLFLAEVAAREKLVRVSKDSVFETILESKHTDKNNNVTAETN